MLKMLEAILHGKIATENIDTTGHKRLRGQLQCDGSCDGCGACAAACPVGAVSVPGVVTRNLEQALRMTYAAMPEPKMVMACGACACGGETYGSTYAVVGRAADVVPVDIAVPGCPPRPAAIIVALCAAADMLKERM